MSKTTAYKLVEYQSRAGTPVHFTVEDVKKFMVRGNPEKTTLQELVFFSGVCRARGMDPLAGDCYLIKYGNDPAAIITARAYFESRAKAQVDCDGWKAGIIVLKDEGQGEEVKRIGALPRPGDHLIGGWFEGYSSKWKFPLELEVNLQMYIKTRKDGAVTQFWKPEKQAHMIRKVALVQGLRELWPNEFANLYAPEEISPEAEEPEAITVEASSVVTDVKAEIEKAAEKERNLRDPVMKDIMNEEQLVTTEPPPAEPPMKTSPEAEADVERNALIKTFDARIEKTGIPMNYVGDFLFYCLGLPQAQEHGCKSVLDLKVMVMKEKRIEQFISDLQGYAGKKADEAAAGEEPKEGATPDPGADLPAGTLPEGLDPGDPDWRTMPATEVRATFVRDRNPGYFRVKIRKHPEVMYCDEEVVRALRTKWKTRTKSGEVFGGKFDLDTFWHGKLENNGEAETEPSTVDPDAPEWITNEQHRALDSLIVNKWGVGWKQFLEYAEAQDAIVNVQEGDMTLRKIKHPSAVEFLADPDKTKQAMVAFFTEQDKRKPF